MTWAERTVVALATVLFASSVLGLPNAGPSLRTGTVQDGRGRVAPAVKNITGTGYCEPETHDAASGITSVTCYGPRHLLIAGEAIDILAKLKPSPYPPKGDFLLISQSLELVDDNLRRVPLDEVYFHHVAASYHWLGTLGTEFRGVAAPMPAPYGRVISGELMADEEWRATNIELVSQLGVRPEHRKQCVECWCDLNEEQDVDTFAPSEVVNGTKVPVSRWGTFLCCRQCPSDLSHEPPRGYRMQYNLTFRAIQPQEHVERVDMIVMNSAEWPQVEYQIPEALGPNTTHVQIRDTTLDALCPQSQPLQVVRCQAHQHFGAQCMELVDLTNNHTICRSCPVVGSHQGTPGDELGYIVKEVETDVNPPYTVQPGTPIRVKAFSDASIPRYGIMGLLWTWVAGMQAPCRGQPGPDVPAPSTLPIPVKHSQVSAQK